MFQMKLHFFTSDEHFPFFIQYGVHDEDLYLHSHQDFFELVIVLSGSAIHIVNNESFCISKGDVFILGTDTYHGYHQTKDFRICNLMFSPEFFFKDNYDIKKAPGFQGLFVIEPILSQKRSFQNRLKLDPYHYEIINHMIDQMITEYTRHAIGFKTLLTGSFYTLAVLLSRLYIHDTPEDSSSDVVGMAHAIAYIEDHYTEELPLNKLAKIAGFSSRHFARRFYEIKQLTPTSYIQSIRLEKASYYLKTTTLPISTIANKCGFSDSNYFARTFKAHYHISPSHFRKHR